jgi:hypothetical protein
MSSDVRRREECDPVARNNIRRVYTEEAARKLTDWFGTADASTEKIADWDIKEGVLAAAVLGVLSRGDGIMFGCSMDGGAISVTIYSGDVKRRKWLNDSIELDDLLAAIAKRAKAGAVAPEAAEGLAGG